MEKRLVLSTHMPEILWFWVPLPEPTNWAQVSEEFWESTAQYYHNISSGSLYASSHCAEINVCLHDFCSGPGNAFLQTQHFKWSRKSLISQNHISLWESEEPSAIRCISFPRFTEEDDNVWERNMSYGCRVRTGTQFFWLLGHCFSWQHIASPWLMPRKWKGAKVK